MESHDNPYNLERFVTVQDPVIDQVKTELRNGEKRTHWMWFIFPQVEGLGSSHTAQKYAISSRDEAEAYLNHPVLGPRLRDCTNIVSALDTQSATEVFGHPDNLKFRSSMTLFATVSTDTSVFQSTLNQYFDSPDEYTIQFLHNNLSFFDRVRYRLSRIMR